MDWTSIIVGALGVIGGSGLTTIINARNIKKGGELENTAKLIDEYQSYIQALKEENAEAKRERDEYKAQVSSLLGEVNELKRRLAVVEARLSYSQTIANHNTEQDS